MTTTTFWPARLSRDGGRVLCGWTVDGRQTCSDVLAYVTGSAGQMDGPPVLMFPAHYDTERAPGGDLSVRLYGPELPAGGAALLRITEYARKRDHGQEPASRPAQRRALRGAGRLAPLPADERIGRDFPLPVILPCLHGHMNRVDDSTLEGLDSNPPSVVD